MKLTWKQKRVARVLGVIGLVSAFVIGTATSYYLQARREWMVKANLDQLLAETRISPNDAELLHVAAVRMWQSGKRPEEAYKLGARALRLQPNRSPTEMFMGHACMTLKRPAEALVHFERAAKLDEKSFDAHRAAGQLYLQIGMGDRALEHLSTAWNPVRPDVTVRLGTIQALVLLQRYNEAEQLCQQAIGFSPENSVDGLLLLGRILHAQGRGAEFRKVIDEYDRRFRHKLSSEFYAKLALGLLDANGLNDAAWASELVEYSAKRPPRSAAVHEARGALLLRQGDAKRAAVEFRRALAMEPKRQSCRLRLGDCLRALGRDEEADQIAPKRSHLRDAVRAGELQKQAAMITNPEQRLGLAQSLADAGDHAGALRCALPLIMQDGGTEEARAICNQAMLSLLAEPGIQQWKAGS